MTPQEATRLLFDAVEDGNRSDAKTAIDAGADVNVRNQWRETPLHRAAWTGQTDTTRLLIEKGADLNAEDKYWQMPLHWAAMKGHAATALAQLLIEKGADPNAEDKYRQTPLHLAAWGGQTDIARLLIERGSDLNAQDDHLQTPLHRAAETGHKETALLLLRHGTDLNSIDIDGQSPCQGTKLLEWLSQLRRTVSENFAPHKPSPAQCFSTTENRAHLHEGVLDACVTGQFTTLIGAPLIASADKADRRLFQNIWEVLPTHWQGQNQDIYMQFVKEGGLDPLVGSHCATGPQESHVGRVTGRRGRHEPQVGR